MTLPGEIWQVITIGGRVCASQLNGPLMLFVRTAISMLMYVSLMTELQNVGEISVTFLLPIVTMRVRL
jgi:hypothetical protein